ncbi:hypothetical protein K438DRAFT_1969329 [Mycena galopus ATCC 62051]|nr:hypothetical protein K438DRAFT_1969329 [Mycena galopus ATCC 62051]
MRIRFSRVLTNDGLGVGDLLVYQHQGRARIPFPDECAGFLYYHRVPHAPPLEGSIRLRVTPDNAPWSLQRGRDLLLPSGNPWQIILLQIASRKQYTGMSAQLLAENLVTQQQLTSCRSLFGYAKTLPENILFRLSQQFVVDLSSNIRLTVVGKALHSICWDLFGIRPENKARFPWAGSALVRFEPSTSPEHSGRRVVFLRVLRIITPVSPRFQHRMLKPEEGKLLAVSPPGGGSKPWSYDIDAHRRAPKCSTHAIALGDLWDNGWF